MFYTDTTVRFHVAPSACAVPVFANYSFLIVAFVTFAQIRASFVKNCENININIINNFLRKKLTQHKIFCLTSLVKTSFKSVVVLFVTDTHFA